MEEVGQEDIENKKKIKYKNGGEGETTEQNAFPHSGNTWVEKAQKTLRKNSYSKFSSL